MKRLTMYLDQTAVAMMEEHLNIYDISGLQIINDQDCAFSEMDWYEDERFEPEALECAVIHVYASDEVLQEILDDFQADSVKVELEEIEDTNWNAKWAESYKGFAVGENLWIMPPWEEAPEHRISIKIEPGMAFGTGTHETTRGCLQALEFYLIEEDEVIDVGSGSGILSIAAIKLGASHVTAVELDETALQNAALNRSLNDIETEITQLSGDLTASIQEPADLMVANILPEVLTRLAARAAALVKPGGILILSGILLMRTEALTAVYVPQFRLLETITIGEWNTLVFQRRDA